MTTKITAILICWIMMVGMTGCVKKEIDSQEPVSTGESIPPEVPVEPEQVPQPGPRLQASLKLTEQGRLNLKAGKPDNAIRVLEQAISLNPANGQNYYYLAEAWLMKKNLTEAREFNSLAKLHLKDDTAWLEKVTRQADRIADLEE